MIEERGPYDQAARKRCPNARVFLRSESVMKHMVLGSALVAALGTIVLGAESAPPPTASLGTARPEPPIASPPPGPIASAPTATGACADNMVLVEGDYCGFVEHACKHFVDNQIERDRCEQYQATSRCIGRSVHKRFCIDKYEFPNIKGIKPVTAVNWEEAAAGCARVGKRLCKDQEWTLACEGPERLPYPYGYTRSAEACNIDRPFVKPDNDKINDPYARADEIERLDRREASGSRAGCVSGFGVHDMTGNADEWVVHEEGKIEKKPYKSGLKGGWWGPVRNRCRPTTTDHNQWHMGFAIGYRCCADVK